MTDHPIIMSASMVLACLREVEQPGTGKTCTRRLLYSDRVAKNGVVPESASFMPDHLPDVPKFGHHWALTGWQNRKPGDRLWIRERARCRSVGPAPGQCSILYAADRGMSDEIIVSRSLKNPFGAAGDSPSIHMPRWASRLTLIITAVRIERLQDISEEDAYAEGIATIPRSPTRHGLLDGYGLAGITTADEASPTRAAAFRFLWWSLHGGASWDTNPWVVVVSFRPILANIDSERAAA